MTVVRRPPNRRACSGPAHSLTYEDARQGPFLARERRALPATYEAEAERTEKAVGERFWVRIRVGIRIGLQTAFSVAGL